MPHASFNVDHLDISSAFQLILWPARPQLGALTAAAFSAFGTDEQAIHLYTLGYDFVSYLQLSWRGLKAPSTGSSADSKLRNPY